MNWAYQPVDKLVERSNHDFGIAVMSNDGGLVVPILHGVEKKSLEALQADLSMTDGSWLSVNANNGLMHNGLQTLQLDGQIEADSDFGYAFYTQSAQIDLKAGSLYSDQPVRLQGPYGHLRAKTMRATERGQRLHFAGDVKVIIFPRSGGAG
jgi:LPS export ABC transporter protein LptC